MAIGGRFSSLTTVVSFKTLIAGAVVILAFAIAVVIAAFALMWVKNGFRTTLAEQQDSLLTRTAESIDRQLAVRKEMLRSISADLPKDESRPVIQDFLLQQTSIRRHFDNFYIFNTQSELIANFNQPVTASERLFSNLSLIKETIASGKELLTISSLENNDKHSVIVLTMPVKNSSGQTVMVVAASIDFSQINLMAHLSELKRGYSGYAYISTEDGAILAHSDPERALKTVSYRSGTSPEWLRLSGKEGTRQAEGAFGITYLVTTKKLQSCNWMLTAVLPEAELLSPIVQAEAVLPAAAAMLAGVCGLLVWWLVHIRMLPLQEANRRLQAQRSVNARATQAQVACADEIDGLIQTVDAFLHEMTIQKRHESDLRNHHTFLHSLIDCLPVLVFVKSLRPGSEGQIIVWNRTAETIMGYSAQQVLGKTCREVFSPQIASVLEELERAMRKDRKVITLPQLRYSQPHGGQRFLHARFVPLTGQEQQLEYVLAIVEDITELRKREEELHYRQAELNAVMEASPMGLIFCNLDGTCRYSNDFLAQLSGMSQLALSGKGWRRGIHPDDRLRLLMELSTWQADMAHPFVSIIRLRQRQGKQVWVTLKVVPVMLDGHVSVYVGSVEDITSRRTGELALSKSEHRLRLVTDNIPALVAYVTPDERIAFANRGYEDAFGVLHEEMFGMHVSEVLGPEVYRQSQQYIRDALGGKTVHFEREVKCEADIRYERVSYIPDIDLEGQVAGYYGLVENITSHKMVEAQLRKLVRVDALTGIANRMQFEEKLDSAIRYSRRYRSMMAVMFLDIDHFKTINDSFGHQGGDEVLREFAQRLLHCVRNTDTVARLAGDEFVIILEGLSMPEEGAAVARKIIGAMEQEFEVLGTTCKVTTSVGVAIRREGEDDAMALLRRADEALYRAKAAGKNTFESVI